MKFLIVLVSLIPSFTFAATVNEMFQQSTGGQYSLSEQQAKSLNQLFERYLQMNPNLDRATCKITNNGIIKKDVSGQDSYIDFESTSENSANVFLKLESISKVAPGQRIDTSSVANDIEKMRRQIRIFQETCANAGSSIALVGVDLDVSANVAKPDVIKKVILEEIPYLHPEQIIFISTQNYEQAVEYANSSISKYPMINSSGVLTSQLSPQERMQVAESAIQYFREDFRDASGTAGFLGMMATGISKIVNKNAVYAQVKFSCAEKPQAAPVQPVAAVTAPAPAVTAAAGPTTSVSTGSGSSAPAKKTAPKKKKSTFKPPRQKSNYKQRGSTKCYW